MAGDLWGADVAQLRTLAQQFGKVSDNLLQTSTLLTNQINNNPSWKGNDASQFRSDWNGSHRTLIQQTAARLKQESRKLLENANEQEKASDAAPGSGGGPGTMGVPGGAAAGAAGGLLVASAMNAHKLIKAPFTLAKHAGQYGWVLKNQRADFIKALTKGQHRLGGPVFDSRNLLQSTAKTRALEGLLGDASKASRGVGLAEKASDITSLKNLHKYMGPLERFAPLLEEKALIGAGTRLEWLGKSGLARGLGWTGVVFSGYETYKSFSEGNLEAGAVNLGKTMLGVGCFLPPPAGTVCQVASVGIAIYENWDTISSVGKNVGEGIVNAVKDPGKFVSNAADTVTDGLKSVGNFLGIGG